MMKLPRVSKIVAKPQTQVSINSVFYFITIKTFTYLIISNFNCIEIAVSGTTN